MIHRHLAETAAGSVCRMSACSRIFFVCLFICLFVFFLNEHLHTHGRTQEHIHRDKIYLQPVWEGRGGLAAACFPRASWYLFWLSGAGTRVILSGKHIWSPRSSLCPRTIQPCTSPALCQHHVRLNPPDPLRCPELCGEPAVDPRCECMWGKHTHIHAYTCTKSVCARSGVAYRLQSGCILMG